MSQRVRMPLPDGWEIVVTIEPGREARGADVVPFTNPGPGTWYPVGATGAGVPAGHTAVFDIEGNLVAVEPPE